MAGGELTFAFCIDQGFAVPLATSLSSLDRVLGDERATVHVLQSRLPALVRRRIASYLPSVNVVWHEVSESRVDKAHHSTFLSAASLYRLLIAEILPESVGRVLYLDSDVIIERPLRDLFETELGGRTIAAVRDASSPWAAGPLGPPWRSLGMQPSSPYFNSGVLLMDLDRWRSERVSQRSLELLRGTKPRWGDQDALNAVLEGDWHEVSRCWNLQTPDVVGTGTAWALWNEDVVSAVARPSIIHFTGREKPWHYSSSHPMTDRWLDALDRTSWAGWRPEERQQSRAATALTDLLRAARDRRGARRSRTDWT